MIKITLPDGSVREFPKGATPMEVAKSINEGLARNMISYSFNGIIDVSTITLTNDVYLDHYTWNDKESKKAFYQSSSHIIINTIQKLYPCIKLTNGPAVENGFY